jgi:hypothetical protein
MPALLRLMAGICGKKILRQLERNTSIMRCVKRLALLPKMVPVPKAGSRHAIEGITTFLVFRKHASGNGGINSCLRPTPLPHDAQAVRETTPCHSSVPF